MKKIRDFLSLHKAASINSLTSCGDFQNEIFCILCHPYAESHALQRVHNTQGTLSSNSCLSSLLVEIFRRIFFSFLKTATLLMHHLRKICVSHLHTIKRVLTFGRSRWILQWVTVEASIPIIWNVLYQGPESPNQP